MRSLATGPIACVVLAACSSGTSTAEVEKAAIERARGELGLAADAPLEATAWVGEDHEGDMVVCGTVSASEGSAAMGAKRFAARTGPIEWIHFEDAHASSIPAQPDKFVSWTEMCGNRGGAGELDG